MPHAHMYGLHNTLGKFFWRLLCSHSSFVMGLGAGSGAKNWPQDRHAEAKLWYVKKPKSAARQAKQTY